MHREAPNGVFVIQEGPILASTDKIVIKIKGKVRHHGGLSSCESDPIVMAAEIINALQTIITREIEASETVILSLCKINGGSAFNIIPDSVEIRRNYKNFQQ
ncbi:peptidase dimerization domain-containing protein [Brachyspira hyodysenteriae]|nr:peptidase dimerization domain-containing protein [Brachyspira hyodysenteriae]MDA1467319.1 peptidase dimerization domain-containing protein [Brachyspira hyodysenteriae]